MCVPSERLRANERAHTFVSIALKSGAVVVVVDTARARGQRPAQRQSHCAGARLSTSALARSTAKAAPAHRPTLGPIVRAAWANAFVCSSVRSFCRELYRGAESVRVCGRLCCANGCAPFRSVSKRTRAKFCVQKRATVSGTVMLQRRPRNWKLMY